MRKQTNGKKVAIKKIINKNIFMISLDAAEKILIIFIQESEERRACFTTHCKISPPNTEKVQLMSRAAAARLWRPQTCAVATAAPPDRSAEL